MRKVNQEINLVFLGSAYTVFADEILAEFNPKAPVAKIDLGFGNYFNIFEDINSILEYNKDEIFILGVDTAVSTAAKADYSAMVLTKASNGEQIGEWHGKISVLKRYAVIIKKLIRSIVDLYNTDEDNFKVIIERNSIGLGVIEEISYDDTFDYQSFLYKTEIRKGEKAFGIATKKDTREVMFDLLLSLINENPDRIRGPLLQEELRNLEQKANGRIEAGKGTHDDIIMAYNFTLFIRNEMIKKGLINADNNFKKFDQKVISSDINVAFHTLYEKQLRNKKDYEVIDDYDEKAYKSRVKELKKLAAPIIKNDTEEDFYEILSF